jgi:hypothetical protein
LSAAREVHIKLTAAEGFAAISNEMSLSPDNYKRHLFCRLVTQAVSL